MNQELAPKIPTKLQTPLNQSAFNAHLSHHPHRHCVQQINSIIETGADIGFRGPHHTRFTSNANSASAHANILLAAMSKEIAVGHTINPFSHPLFSSFVSSLLGVREKKNGSFRIILNLSRPRQDSVNDHIAKDEFFSPIRSLTTP